MSANLLQPSRPAFHRAKGSFADELTTARTDLDRKDRSRNQNQTPSESSDTAPSLSPTGSATPSTPQSEVTSPISPPVGDSQDVVADGFAFAFDIDGVLVRGGRAIPEAIEAMKVLNGENKYNIKM